MAFTINNVKLTYPHLFEPHSFDGESKKKYQTGVIIEKGSEQEAKIKAEYERVAKEALESKKLTKATVTPLVKPAGSNYGLFTDCDLDPDKYDPKYFKNCWVMNVKSDTKPAVVDTRNQPIDKDANEIYGGVVANVNLNVYSYFKTGKGITAGLNGVQKVRGGEAFGGNHQTVTDMFGEPDEETMFD